jgi:hypothetical protein
MLAYFFTHWPLETVAPADYEHALQAFHRSLVAHPPQGFQRSWSLAVQGLPWVNRGQSAYEDWYLVDERRKSYAAPSSTARALEATGSRSCRAVD